MGAYHERGDDIVHAGRHHFVHQSLEEMGTEFQFGHQGHATAAFLTRIEEPGKLEFPEGRPVRSHDKGSFSTRILRADAQNLVGVVNLGLLLSDTRRHPPVQKLRIALDIGGEIEHGAIRHDRSTFSLSIAESSSRYLPRFGEPLVFGSSPILF